MSENDQHEPFQSAKKIKFYRECHRSCQFFIRCAYIHMDITKVRVQTLRVLTSLCFLVKLKPKKLTNALLISIKLKDVIRKLGKISWFVLRFGYVLRKICSAISDIDQWMLLLLFSAKSFFHYSQGHLNMMVRIKELQRRLDQTLGKPGSYLAGIDRVGNVKPMTVGARLYRVEQQVR